MFSKLSTVALALGVIAALGLAAAPAEAGGGCHQAMTEEVGTTVMMKNACFSPAITHVRAGETVAFVNEDVMPHTVTGAGSSWGDYTELQAIASVEHRFDDAGVYPYFCLLHPGMIGAVVVDGAGGETVLRADGAVVPNAGSAPNAALASDGEGGGIALTAAIAAGAAIGAGALAAAGGFVLGRRRSG
jgi:plastocyanin